MFLHLQPTQSTQIFSTSQVLSYAHNKPSLISWSRSLKGTQQPTHPWNVNTTIKIKFKRKGGWIRSFSNWLTPYRFKFGYGHPVIQFGTGSYRHRYKRYLTQHCIIWAHANRIQPDAVYNATSVKPFNCYTQRGIRTSRFFLIKRKGKESKYTHLKSKIF